MSDMTTTLLPHIRLKFNMEHPSYEECYYFGYECALAELSEAENPFRADTQEGEYWLEGWWDALYGEKPLFDMTSAEPDEEEQAANDQEYCRNKILTLMFEISGAIAASAILGYQLLELVA